MNIEKVESLLERSRPAPPPPELRRRVVEAAALKVRPVSASRKPRFVEVMTVAASILMLLGTVTWLLRAAPPVANPAGPQGQPFEERRLSDQLPGFSGFTWSADGKHWGCVATGDEGMSCAVIDGKKEREYTQVQAPIFGTNGRYAYVAHDPKEGPVLVLNGVPQKDFETYQTVAWSPDGKKLAFVGTQGTRTYLVVDGKKSEPYDAVWEVVWSPDGQSFAYSAKLDQDWFRVLDGKRGEPFDAVRDLTFSPDGKVLAYAANEGEWTIVVGEEKGQEYASVGPPVFSADGTTLGYTAEGGGGSLVVVVSRSGGQVKEVQSFYSEVGTPALSRNGKVWAYRALPLPPADQNKLRVVVGRELHVQEDASPAFDSVCDPVVSPDGAQVAFAGRKGSRQHLVVGGKATAKFSLLDRISFGPDNQTVAFRAGQYGKQFVLAGKSRSDEFDEVVIGPVWSADGKKVAFTARKESELWSKVLEVK